MQQAELNKIIKDHKKGKRADLSNAHLSNVLLMEVDLRGAYLTSARLSGAILIECDLRNVNLITANMADADLTKADLRNAKLVNANLKGADLTGADLRGARLGGVFLKDANLEGAKFDYQIQKGLLKKIAKVVLDNPKERLNMKEWDSHCFTSHCLAGWAVALNATAKELLANNGYEAAGLLTLGPEAHSMFYKSYEEVLEYLKGKL